MGSTLPKRIARVEDMKLDRLRMAKAKVGAAVKQAIGDQPLKAFGDEGLVSKLTTGEKVPDYLARICEDDGSRKRFALALLKGTPKAKVRVFIEVEDDEEMAA